jgi:hypothetical protein
MNRIIVGTDDKTKELNNFHSENVVFDATGSIYVSSFFKFNHIYIDIPNPEQTALTDVKISICDGTTFTEVLDVVDETYGFTKSGFITFTPHKSQPWCASDTENITELSTFSMAQRYWIKIEATFTSCDINWIGNLFTDDDDIKDEFFDLCSEDMYAALGTTSHLVKHIRAAELIVNQLKTGSILYNEGALLVRTDYRPASIMKVAEMVYMQLGSAYVDQMNNCRKEFMDRMSKTQPKLDKNNNATESAGSGTIATGRLFR